MRKLALSLTTGACLVGLTSPPNSFAEDPALTNTSDNLQLVVKIHKRILDGLKEKSPADMKPYKTVIPGSDVPYEMVPIPGGEFMMGSPDGEANRKPDEGPQHKVKIEPFWMGKLDRKSVV